MGRRIRDGRPSPAIIVAALALVAALAGTALAGPQAGTSAINKKKVKKIATKQATKKINELAPGLSVAEAAKADVADNADALGGKPPSAYAGPTNYRIEQNNKNLSSLAPGASDNVRASCDPGEHVIGGGGESSSGGLVMKEGWPLNTNEWTVQFYNANSFTLTTPQIIAFAICASAD
jgi:hypothetical protein